jgi:hypothetical protein
MNPFEATEEAEAEAYCRQAAGTPTPGIGPRLDPWPYYLFNVQTFFLSPFADPPY